MLERKFLIFLFLNFNIFISDKYLIKQFVFIYSPAKKDQREC